MNIHDDTMQHTQNKPDNKAQDSAKASTVTEQNIHQEQHHDQPHHVYDHTQQHDTQHDAQHHMHNHESHHAHYEYYHCITKHRHFKLLAGLVLAAIAAGIVCGQHAYNCHHVKRNRVISVVPFVVNNMRFIVPASDQEATITQSLNTGDITITMKNGDVVIIKSGSLSNLPKHGDILKFGKVNIQSTLTQCIISPEP